MQEIGTKNCFRGRELPASSKMWHLSIANLEDSANTIVQLGLVSTSSKSEASNPVLDVLFVFHVPLGQPNSNYVVRSPAQAPGPEVRARKLLQIQESFEISVRGGSLGGLPYQIGDAGTRISSASTHKKSNQGSRHNPPACQPIYYRLRRAESTIPTGSATGYFSNNFDGDNI